jgi:phenylacetic acid degradation operon negative regulatory protein
MLLSTASPRPSSLIFTLYGDLVHRFGESLRIGSLIRLMAPFGLSPAAVRQAVSRMVRQGWLVARPEEGRAVYAVSERGRRRIAALSPRIYGPLVEWDGRWRLLVYRIPEDRRDGRDRLRKELAVLGWAPLATATWISPRDSVAEALEVARSAGIADELVSFEGPSRGPLSDRALVERCWDLAAIAAAYRRFLASYRPRLEAERTRPVLSDEEAFVERLLLLHDFRKFTYLDPGLPSALLPAHWPGTAAAALFRDYYALLEDRATTFFRSAA